MSKSAEWRTHLEKWKASDLSADAFAEQQGLTAQALKWWRWKIGDDDAKAAKAADATNAAAKAAKEAKAKRQRAAKTQIAPVFTEVVTVPPPRASSMFEVVLDSGAVVRVAADFDDDALRRLLGVLR